VKYLAITPDQKRDGDDWTEYNAFRPETAAREHALMLRESDSFAGSNEDWNGQVIVKDPAGNMTIFDVDIEVVVDVRDLGAYDESEEES